MKIITEMKKYIRGMPLFQIHDPQTGSTQPYLFPWDKRDILTAIAAMPHTVCETTAKPEIVATPGKPTYQIKVPGMLFLHAHADGPNDSQFYALINKSAADTSCLPIWYCSATVDDNAFARDIYNLMQKKYRAQQNQKAR